MSRLSSGLLHVVESCCGHADEPDVLWYVLALPYQASNCPTPNNPAPPQTAPYLVGAVPNPNNPGHPDNVARHWAVGSTIPYRIWVPPNKPITSTIFSPGGVPYRYLDFQNDVAAVLGYWTSMPWVDLNVAQGTCAHSSVNYDGSGVVGLGIKQIW
ncbi:MAG TPA: hypothetical protein VEI02_04710, partial [Planctomycetota bacterium]|nr:hypothetical protein [Planctomycetota bacterium]